MFIVFFTNSLARLMITFPNEENWIIEKLKIFMNRSKWNFIRIKCCTSKLEFLVSYWLRNKIGSVFFFFRNFIDIKKLILRKWNSQFADSFDWRNISSPSFPFTLLYLGIFWFSENEKSKNNLNYAQKKCWSGCNEIQIWKHFFMRVWATIVWVTHWILDNWPRVSSVFGWQVHNYVLLYGILLCFSFFLYSCITVCSAGVSCFFHRNMCIKCCLHNWYTAINMIYFVCNAGSHNLNFFLLSFCFWFLDVLLLDYSHSLFCSLR